MNIQAEISLYPLRTGRTSPAINTFMNVLKKAGVSAQTQDMSSTLSGDADVVFSAVHQAFKAAAEGRQVVLVMKVSNACGKGPH
jgi:uncharacterized protein YqgV (UPF0045/DUF77 family)